MKYQVGQVLKLTHDSNNIYYGEVISRSNILYAQTKFFDWAIRLDNIDNPKACQFKSCEIAGQMPQDAHMLELSQETLEYIKELPKLKNYTEVKNLKNKK